MFFVLLLLSSHSSSLPFSQGIGDRHTQNILIDKSTAEFVHIDFGVILGQGRFLKIPELVPFRLTRDVVDGMGIMGVEGKSMSSFPFPVLFLLAFSLIG
jgi:phosphatidylinositol kinase/protein kinase (PI-3  family)